MDRKQVEAHIDGILREAIQTHIRETARFNVTLWLEGPEAAMQCQPRDIKEILREVVNRPIN